MSKLLPLVGVLTLLMGLAWQVNAAELSLVCPCQAERVGQTAVKITAGVINTGDTESGELRVDLSSSNGLPIFFYNFQAFRYFPETLKPGVQYSAGTEATVAFRLPTADVLDSLGRTNLLLGLQEKVNGEWLTRDIVRLGEPVNFSYPETGGESANYKLFFEGKPTLEIAGDQATLRIPKVVNSSLEAVTISRVVVGNYSSAELWGQTFRYGLNNENLSIIVAAQSSLTNIEIKGAYMGPVTNYPFTHLSLRNEQGGVEVWETIEAREGNVISTYPFTANSFDFLVDSDDDDVSDVNENLFNTDPNDFLSQPGTLVIDVMALYTPAVAAKYNDEPVTRILHELEWGNQAFRNSNINARFRLVRAQSTNYEGLDSRVAISAVADQSGVFEGIDAVRQDAGADLLVLYIEDDPGDDSCGIGDLAGVDLNGDMAFTRRSQIVSVVAAGCRSSTLTHEFGHNLGLGHDAREESNKGAFGWSRGHGVDGSFVTTMAYQSGYSYFGPDIQYFSNPDISCQGQPCGVDRSDLSLGADAALSIRTTMYQIAELTPQVKERDLDGDGFLDQADNCPLVSSVNQLDTDGDGKGNACDDDDDGDGVLDKADAFPLDSTEALDSDGDGMGDNFEARYGLNISDPTDANQDADNDGLTNLQEYSGGSDPTNPSSPTVPNSVRASAKADFNGDGKPDVLIRSNGGSWWLYIMDGASIVDEGRIPATGSTDWEPQSFADFNGDGKADILIRHKALGLWWLYTMNGRTILTSERVLATRDLNFKPLSFNDTNNDGKADILLRHIDGRWWRYGMSGPTILSNSAVAATRDTNFEPVSYDDFSGDGNADILVRNKINGIWFLYQLNGEVVVAAGAVGANRSLDWAPESTADFNGDGMADLLVRNKETKDWWLYTLNGNAVGTSTSLKASRDSTWHRVATEDFEGDGNADLLIRSEQGSWWMYTLNGSTITSEGRVAMIGNPDWRAVSFADFNGDIKADVLMRNVATGVWWLYTLDGQTVLSSKKVNATPKLDWQLQPEPE